MHAHHIIPLGNKKKKKNNHHVINQKLTFSPPPTINTMPPKKDQAPIYIDGPKMGWSMDDGLYSCFQDWKLECELILDGELAEIAEPRKVNTLIRWAGSFGLKNLKVWQKDKTNLTLTFIWNEFETYCKSHSNELRARYELFSEESPDVTATTIRQKLKKLEAGRATAKYIRGTNTIGKDPTVEGVNQV